MTVRSSEITYTAERVDTDFDSKRIRIITRYEGPFSPRRPRHVETMSEEQARQLRNDLTEVLDGAE